ncbi:hypothetical protein KKB06_02665, partial [Patescibacteria group bacterium]|nr:hypothetical protein [Patescibacteria group bacterium]
FGLSKITLDGSQDEIHLSHFRAPVLKILFSKNNFTIVENGLDPYYTTNGSRKVVDDLFYLFCLLIKKVSGANIYDTIWVAVKTK